MKKSNAIRVKAFKKDPKFTIVLIQRETILTRSNFNILPKTNQMSWTKILAVFVWRDDDFKTTRLNSWSTHDFV